MSPTPTAELSYRPSELFANSIATKDSSPRNGEQEASAPRASKSERGGGSPRDPREEGAGRASTHAGEEKKELDS